MEKKYRILGEFIKDISAKTNDVESYIYTKENISKFNLAAHIEPIIDTSENASKLIQSDIDFVFIDGSHTFESARNDYACWSPKIKEGGILAIHDIYDTEMEGGQAPREIYLKALDEGYELLKRVESLVILQKLK